VAGCGSDPGVSGVNGTWGAAVTEPHRRWWDRERQRERCRYRERRRRYRLDHWRRCSVTRLEVVAAGAVVVVFLWLGGQQGAAALIGLIGAVAYAVDMAVFDTTKCWCDNGKVRSWWTATWKRHRACGGTGERPRLSRRLWFRRVK
jgi:hypothetical protein